MMFQVTPEAPKGLRKAIVASVDGLQGWNLLHTQTQYPAGQVNPLPSDEDFTNFDLSYKTTVFSPYEGVIEYLECTTRQADVQRRNLRHHAAGHIYERGELQQTFLLWILRSVVAVPFFNQGLNHEPPNMLYNYSYTHQGWTYGARKCAGAFLIQHVRRNQVLRKRADYTSLIQWVNNSLPEHHARPTSYP